MYIYVLERGARRPGPCPRPLERPASPGARAPSQPDAPSCAHALPTEPSLREAQKTPFYVYLV